MHALVKVTPKVERSVYENRELRMLVPGYHADPLAYAFSY